MASRTERVAMRDGVRLATDLHLPEGDGPWPVILLRTPYDKDAVPMERLHQALLIGYAVVVQDWRGRFASEGRQLLFTREAEDGYDTCAWLVAQPWCNGKIGSHGSSALGIAQTLLAPLDPPGLACANIDVASGNLHRATYQNGALRIGLSLPYMVVCGYEQQNLNVSLDHPHYDEFWQPLHPDAAAERIAVPALHTGGWFDIFCQHTLDTFVAWQHRSRAAGEQKLVIGPWCHGRGAQAGELTFPAAADLPVPWRDAEWIDCWLKGVDTGVRDQPAVTYYLMGDPDDDDAPGCHWCTADDWPVPCTPRPWHLRHDGGLTRESPGVAEPARSLCYDPTMPVRTIGGCELNLPAGPRDQRPVEDRDDVLIYTSAPLTEPLAIVGRVTARLWVTSSAVDTDFTVKLCDVYPDGRSMLVCDGIQRLRYRPGPEYGRPVGPGMAVPCEVDCWSTALVFARGHRIRVAVSSSNYPRFDLNPNTGRWSHEERQPVTAENTVISMAGRSSELLLPLVPVP